MNNSKFKTVENLSFGTVNKKINDGIIYTTYFSLLKKFSNEKLYPIIFSINNPKMLAYSRFSSNHNPRCWTGIIKKDIVKNLQNKVTDNSVVLNNCLLKSDTETVQVSKTEIHKIIEDFEEINKKCEQIERIDSSRVPMVKQVDRENKANYFITYITFNAIKIDDINQIALAKYLKIMNKKIDKEEDPILIIKGTSSELRKELEDEKYIVHEKVIQNSNDRSEIDDIQTIENFNNKYTDETTNIDVEDKNEDITVEDRNENVVDEDKNENNFDSDDDDSIGNNVKNNIDNDDKKDVNVENIYNSNKILVITSFQNFS